MRYDHFSMLPERAFQPIGGRMTLEGGGKGSAPAAPDYTPMANASEAAARIGAEQGDRVLAESKRQYDRNLEVAQPIIDAQTKQMQSAQDQGDEYFNYWKTNAQPVEKSMAATAMQDTSGADAASRATILNQVTGNAAQDATERALITGGDQGIYDARKADIENGVGTAVADVRNGQTTAANMMVRNALRYGYSPAKIAAMAGTTAGANASAVAAAANGTRTAGIDKSRALLGDSYNMRNTTNGIVVNALAGDRSMRLQDDATGWAKKLDVAGVYRGMPGASTGAYGAATAAGNAAVNNSVAVGAGSTNGTIAAGGLTNAGAATRVSGLGSILNSQTAMYDSQAAANASASGGVMGLVGSGIGAAATIY